MALRLPMAGGGRSMKGLPMTNSYLQEYIQYWIVVSWGFPVVVVPCSAVPGRRVDYGEDSWKETHVGSGSIMDRDVDDQVS